MLEVGGGELKFVEHEGGGLVVDGFVVEAVEHLHDADLDGGTVFENGKTIDIVAASAVELLLMEEAVGVLAERRCVAGAAVGFDVIARAHVNLQFVKKGRGSRVSGRDDLKAKEVDPLPPVLNVYFQQLREGSTSKFLILHLVTGKYLISKRVIGHRRSEKPVAGLGSRDKPN